jgi:serine/threonine-protein kinase
MLTGELPTSGIHPIGALAYAICHVPVPSLADRAPHVPPGLAAVVHRALTIDTGARFPSIAAMLEALRPFAPNGSEISERSIDPNGDLAALALSAEPVTAPWSRERGIDGKERFERRSTSRSGASMRRSARGRALAGAFGLVAVLCTYFAARLATASGRPEASLMRSASASPPRVTASLEPPPRVEATAPAVAVASASASVTASASVSVSVTVTPPPSTPPRRTTPLARKTIRSTNQGATTAAPVSHDGRDEL